MDDKPRAELEKLGAPPDVTAALVTLCAELERLAGPNLHGVILYGGVARGRFTKGRSDVNVAVVLREASSASLAKIAPALRNAFRSMRVEPFLLTPEEVRRAADVFPTKLLDIRDHHVVLQGEDPFVGLEVEREHIRLRIEQELRNLALRLRRRFVSVWDSPDELAATLGEIAAPLSVELLALTKLAAKPLPADDSIEQILAAAARAFELDSGALARLPVFRGTGGDGETSELYGRVLATVARAAEIADRLEAGGSRGAEPPASGAGGKA